MINKIKDFFNLRVFDFPYFCFDFGSKYLRVAIKKKGIFEETNIVAYHVYKKKYLFFGKEAEELIGKVPSVVKLIFPIQKGVINDFDGFLALLENIKYSYIFKYWKDLRWVFPLSFSVASVPYFATEIEQKAAQEILRKIGFHNFFLVHSSIAAALSVNLDIFETRPFIILDIGADKTEISIISKGGIIYSRYLDFGGNFINYKIKNYIHLKHAVVIGELTAERIKKELLFFSNKKKFLDIKGKSLDSGLPTNLKISSDEVREASFSIFSKIIEQLKSVLEEAPPEIIEDIVEEGIYLIGGLAKIPGIHSFLSKEVGVKINEVEKPTKAVILGLKILAERKDLLSKLSIPEI